MKLREWLDEWSMTSLKINIHFLELEWQPNDHDRDAAWDLYIEMLTRVTTQHLEPEHGDEGAALASIFSLFDLTRGVIKKQGRHCIEFTKIAVVVLNQVIRPFTAKWHRIEKNSGFKEAGNCRLFREELAALQQNLRVYSKMLADMAGVEDLTTLEETE